MTMGKIVNLARSTYCLVAQRIVNVCDLAIGRIENRPANYDQILEILERARINVHGDVDQGVAFGRHKYRRKAPLLEAIERFRAFYELSGGQGHYTALEMHHTGGRLVEHHIKFRRNPKPGHESFKAGAFFIFQTLEKPRSENENRNP